jgi:hypothetical protein
MKVILFIKKPRALGNCMRYYKKNKMKKKQPRSIRYSNKKAGKLKRNLLLMQKNRRRERAQSRLYIPKATRKRKDVSKPFQPVFKFHSKSKFHS